MSRSGKFLTTIPSVAKLKKYSLTVKYQSVILHACTRNYVIETFS